jgi:hypothetical protein
LRAAGWNSAVRTRRRWIHDLLDADKSGAKKILN